MTGIRYFPTVVSNSLMVVFMIERFCNKIWPLLPLTLLLFGSSTLSFAKAVDQGHGTVSVNGSIIDTACAIETTDRYQIIHLNTESISEMIHFGEAKPHPFSIRLINCTLSPTDATHHREPWSTFSTTFDGPAENGLFKVFGDAAGVGLQISDAAGNISIPGEPMPAGDLLTGDMDLKYNIRLMGDGHTLKAGDYRSIIRFKIDYY